MQVVCPSCQARYRFDERRLGERARAKTKCAKCGGAIEIVNPLATPLAAAPPPAPEPPPPERTKSGITQKRAAVRAYPGDGETDPGKLTGQDIQALLELPKDKRFSLAVIQGAATGQIYPIVKVRTSIGRVGADIELDDPEASRQHAVVEVLGEHAVLRDLGSTNGTFVEGDRIEHAVLGNQTEFRIGGHVIMFIITSVE